MYQTHCFCEWCPKQRIQPCERSNQCSCCFGDVFADPSPFQRVVTCREVGRRRVNGRSGSLINDRTIGFCLILRTTSLPGNASGLTFHSVTRRPAPDFLARLPRPFVHSDFRNPPPNYQHGRFHIGRRHGSLHAGHHGSSFAPIAQHGNLHARRHGISHAGQHGTAFIVSTPTRGPARLHINHANTSTAHSARVGSASWTSLRR
jgi:hypothetical protein